MFQKIKGEKMKKVLLIFILMELIIFINPGNYLIYTSYAVSETNSVENRNEIVEAQKESLNIADFIKEAEKYTKESMPRCRFK